MRIYRRGVEKHTEFIENCHSIYYTDTTDKTLSQLFPATNQRTRIIPVAKPEEMARDIKINSVYK